MADYLPLVVQIVLTAIVTPVLTYYLFIAQSGRERGHRFDEIRLGHYVEFVQKISHTLMQDEFGSAQKSLQDAWRTYESILLTSSLPVISACWKLRGCAEDCVRFVGDWPAPRSDERTAELERLVQVAWRQVTEFQVVARGELKLDPISVDAIYAEIDKNFRASRPEGLPRIMHG